MTTRHRAACALAILLSISATTARAGNQIEVLAISDQSAPGTPAFFKDFFAPSINPAGEIAFQGYLKTAGGASLPGGSWFGTPGAVSLLTLGQQSAPGTGSTFTGSPGFLASPQAGEVYWKESLFSGASSVPSGIFHQSTPAGLATVTFSGQTAPGAGVSTFNSFGPSVPVQPGKAVFFAALNATTINTSPSTDAGFWLVQNNTPQLLAQLGGTAPDVASTYAALAGIRLNTNATVAFYANLENTPNLGQPGGPPRGTNTGIYDAIFTGAPGNLHLAARAADPAPGYPAGSSIGTMFSSAISLNNAGQIIFPSQVNLAGGGTTTALWMRQPNGALASILKTGDAMPSAINGETINSVFSGFPLLNHDGAIGLKVGLAGPSVNGNNNSAILAGLPGALATVVRTGDSVPGIPGATFVNFDNFFLNDNGEIAFEAYFTGPDIAGGNYGLWFYRPGFGISEVLRDGQTITLAPGDTRIIAPTSFHPGIVLSGGGSTEDGLGHSFNNNNQLPVHLFFTDGSTAVVRLTALADVPEPTTLTLLTLATTATLLHRRRK